MTDATDSQSLTRARLVHEIYTKEIQCTRKELRSMIDSVFLIMTEALLEETEVKISGFGKLKTKHKSARVGRNPKTEEQLIISKRKIVSFHPSRLLTQRLNQTDGQENGPTPS